MKNKPNEGKDRNGNVVVVVSNEQEERYDLVGVLIVSCNQVESK